WTPVRVRGPAAYGGYTRVAGGRIGSLRSIPRRKWMSPLEDFLHVPRVAYFSMEIALESAIPTYSGGLGVLAGDAVRSAADLELPLVAVSLVFRGGHFRQCIDAAGRQVEE